MPIATNRVRRTEPGIETAAVRRAPPAWRPRVERRTSALASVATRKKRNAARKRKKLTFVESTAADEQFQTSEHADERHSAGRTSPTATRPRAAKKTKCTASRRPASRGRPNRATPGSRWRPDRRARAGKTAPPGPRQLRRSASFVLILTMAKLKLAGKKKKATAARPGGAIPCIVFVVLGSILMSLLFYAMLKSG